jgi:4-hydroxy-2-oxovalerate aldolase
MKEEDTIKILETTLRDGSYTINYQFTASETQYIAKILDEIGFEYIEIGPGIGFNAKEFSEHKPATSDEEYIIAARKVVKNAKLGMFFIPGIGRSQDIDMAAQNGLDLIRIGTNINEHEKAYKYIEHCAKNDIETCCNLMKSYAVSSTEFAQIANECYTAGTGTVYLVDSAGGMLPEDVKSFISETKSLNPNIKVGFHGHDNLGLAIANTLMAIQCGASIVDSSIKGMGRSSGNTGSEKLIFVLKRMGYDLKYNVNKLLELSDKVILPYLSGKPEKTLDMIYGFSQFHSSFIGVIEKYADIYDIDAKDLIVEYTKLDKLNINEDVLSKLAESLSRNERNVYNFVIEDIVVKKTDPEEQMSVLYQELYELKHKFDKKIFFNISKSYENSAAKISPVVHTCDNISFASAEVKENSEIEHIVNRFKDSVDGFLIDKRIGMVDVNKFSKGYFYDDSKLFAKSIFNYISAIMKEESITAAKLYIDERNEIVKAFLDAYSEFFSFVDQINDADIAILGHSYYSRKSIDSASLLKWVIITKSGCIESDISSHHSKINFIRIDLSRELFAEINAKMNYEILISNNYGVKKIENEWYCSGGFVGPQGAIVVDNINHIKHRYGISNGDGSINYY